LNCANYLVEETYHAYRNIDWNVIWNDSLIQIYKDLWFETVDGNHVIDGWSYGGDCDV